MKKFCTKCGRQFEAIGREVICPSCKAQAAEDAKRAAVLKAKRASWTGESVPVRISGRASTVIRRYGAEKSLPFAVALDALLKASPFFISTGTAWEDITPYKSRRRDKAPSTQDVVRLLGVPAHDVKQDVKQAAKTSTIKAASKASASKTSTSKTSTIKTSASKASASKASASKTSASKTSASK